MGNIFYTKPTGTELEIGMRKIRDELNQRKSLSKRLSKMTDRELNNMETNEKKLRGIKLCRIIDVYDGDTATIIFYNDGKLECHKFRVYGYDSPEMRVPLAWEEKKRKKKKKLAVDARDAFSDYIKGKTLVVELMGTEKYGRVLGKLYVFANGIQLTDLPKHDICTYMIGGKYGYAYTGGKKKS